MRLAGSRRFLFHSFATGRLEPEATLPSFAGGSLGEDFSARARGGGTWVGTGLSFQGLGRQLGRNCAGESVADVRTSVIEAAEAGTTLLELGRRARGAAREAMSAAERQIGVIREITSKRPALDAERAKLARAERDILAPAVVTLAQAVDHLEVLWQYGAVRDSLRTRLEGAIRAIQDHSDRDEADRAQLSARLEHLRESGVRWQSALEAGRRRESLVRDVTRDIRELTGAADR